MYLVGKEGKLKHVASGERYPTEPGMTVHCVPLRDGCAKVKIISVKIAARGLALPVEEQEIANLGQAQDNFVQWPEELIRDLGKVI